MATVGSVWVAAKPKVSWPASRRRRRRMRLFRPRVALWVAAATVTSFIAYYLRRVRRARLVDTTASAASAAVPQPSVGASQQPAAAAPSDVTPSLENGSCVRLKGLSSKPELNGQLGRIIGFDAAKGRYNVSLSGNHKTTPHNIVAARKQSRNCRNASLRAIGPPARSVRRPLPQVTARSRSVRSILRRRLRLWTSCLWPRYR